MLWPLSQNKYKQGAAEQFVKVMCFLFVISIAWKDGDYWKWVINAIGKYMVYSNYIKPIIRGRPNFQSEKVL